MFGKSVPLLAIVMVSLLAIGGSASLATYLSNKVTADVTIKSPMTVGVSLGLPSWATTECWRPAYTDGNGDPVPGGNVLSFPESDLSNIHDWTEGDWTTGEATLEIPDVYGGATMTVYLRSVNLADALIEGFEEVIVHNSGGVTSADFKHVKVRTDSIYGDLGYGEEHELIPGGIIQLNPNNVQFGSAGASTWGAGETDVIKIEVTFNEAAFGTYIITYRIVPAP